MELAHNIDYTCIENNAEKKYNAYVKDGWYHCFKCGHKLAKIVKGGDSEIEVKCKHKDRNKICSAINILKK